MNTSLWAANIRHSLFFLVLAALFGWQGARSHDGGDWALSPALFPLLLSASLGLLALALLLQGYRRLKKGAPATSTQGADSTTGSVFLVFGLCCAYAFVLPWAGFFPATALFLALFSLLIGERRLWTIALLSFLSPAAVLIIFRHGLNVLLP